MRVIVPVLACCTLLLAACGDARDGAAGQAAVPRQLAGVAAQAATIDAEEGVRRLYLAYLGRAPDAGGLVFFAAALRAAGLPAEPGALAARYADDAVARSLLDGLAGSAEAQALQAGEADAVAPSYRHLFNREPDPAGAAWWRVALASGLVERKLLPLVILAGAAGADLAVLENKLALARAFGATLADPAAAAAYQGDAAIAALRQALGQVSGTLDAAGQAALLAQVKTALAAQPLFSQVQAIVRARCVACHSEHPTMPGFTTAPRNTRFDTPEQIRADAVRIHVNVVQTEFMPYGNRTGMTAAERAVVGAWFAAGAR